MTGQTSGLVALLGLFGILMALALYCLPSIIAICRRCTNWGSVVAINLFAGWTLVGWVLALAMALRSDVSRETYVYVDVEPWVEPQPWVEGRPIPVDELAERRARRHG